MMNMTVSLVSFLMMNISTLPCNLSGDAHDYLPCNVSDEPDGLPCNFSKNEPVCQIETNQQRNVRRECVSERL